jgi:hypothetical protein
MHDVWRLICHNDGSMVSIVLQVNNLKKTPIMYEGKSISKLQMNIELKQIRVLIW